MYIYSQWNVDWWPNDRCAGSMPERMFTIIYSSLYASHETTTSSHIVNYWYRITYPSIWQHNVYINVYLVDETSWDVRSNSVPRWCCFGCSVNWPHIRHSVLLLTTHTPCPHIQTTSLHIQKLTLHIYEKDDLNKRSAKHANKSTLVARGADTQLGSSCISTPIATNVDLWSPIGIYI